MEANYCEIYHHQTNFEHCKKEVKEEGYGLKDILKSFLHVLFR